MDIPPKTKGKSSVIIKWLTIVLVSSPLLLLLISFSINYYLVNQYKCGRKSNEASVNVFSINRSQAESILAKGVFIKTFDELNIKPLDGACTDTSGEFEYKLDIQSPDLAIIGSKPLDKPKRSYTGAVLRSKNGQGLFFTKLIMCESEAGGDGTNSTNFPVVSSSGKLACASGWNETYQEDSPSDSELVKVIRDKAEAELRRVARLQADIYSKQGKFADKYSDLSQVQDASLLKFDVKIRNHSDRSIISIKPKLAAADKDYHVSFTIIKMVGAKQTKAVNKEVPANRRVNLLCTSNEVGTLLPNNRELDRIVDRYPQGYHDAR